MLKTAHTLRYMIIGCVLQGNHVYLRRYILLRGHHHVISMYSLV